MRLQGKNRKQGNAQDFKHGGIFMENVTSIIFQGINSLQYKVKTILEILLVKL